MFLAIDGSGYVNTKKTGARHIASALKTISFRLVTILFLMRKQYSNDLKHKYCIFLTDVC